MADLKERVVEEFNRLICKTNSPNLIYLASVHLPDLLFREELINALLRQKKSKYLFKAGKRLNDSRYDERIASALVDDENIEYWIKAVTNWPDNRSLEILAEGFVSKGAEFYLIVNAKDMIRKNMTSYAKDVLTRTALRSGDANVIAETLHWPDELYSDILGKAFAYLGHDAEFLVAGREVWDSKRIDDDIIDRLSRVYGIMDRVENDWSLDSVERLKEKVEINKDEDVRPRVLEPASIEVNGERIYVNLVDNKEKLFLKIPLKDYFLNIETTRHGNMIESAYLMIPEKGFWYKKDIINSSSQETFTESDSFKFWDKAKVDLEERLNISLGDSPRSVQGLADNLRVFLKTLHNSANKQLDETPITEDNLKEYLSNAVLVDSLKWIPEKFRDDNFAILKSVYSYPWLYSSPDMFSPPSERRDHALRFELTIGCDYNACTFCDGYKGVEFKERSFEEFKEHYEAVKKVVGNYKKNIRRIFIGGGNALSTSQETLIQAIRMINTEFRPRIISTYGRADSIVDKGIEGLKELENDGDGLDLIYWGVESGSDDVLKYVNKGVEQETMIKAGLLARTSNIDLSVMIMPGLGGIKHYQSHVEETVRLLNVIRPKFITFMGVNPSEDSLYSKIMASENDNRPLNNLEVMKQVRSIVNGLDSYGGKIGMFKSSIDSVGCNPFYFNTNLERRRKISLLKDMDKIIYNDVFIR